MPTEQNIEKYTDVANKVLVYTKTMQPRFAEPTTEMVAGWGAAMARTPLPERFYMKAAEDFQVENTDGDWLSVGWLITRAKKLTEEARQRPETAEAMRAFDQARQDEIDRQIADGTFGAVRGYAPKEVEAPREPVPHQAEEFIAQLRRRQAQNA